MIPTTEKQGNFSSHIAGLRYGEVENTGSSSYWTTTLKKGNTMFHSILAIDLNATELRTVAGAPGEHVLDTAARALSAEYAEVTLITDTLAIATDAYGSAYVNPLMTAMASRLVGQQWPVYGSATFVRYTDDDTVPLTPADISRLTQLAQDDNVRIVAGSIQRNRSLDLV